MAEEKIVKLKTVGAYNGHNIKANKAIDLSLKMKYSELTNYIQLVQLLNENVTIIAKVGEGKAQKLGTFMIKEIKIDHDGEGIVKFNSTLDYVEADNLNGLAGEILKLMFQAEIELEEKDEDS